MTAPETIQGYRAIRLHSATADLDAAFLPHVGLVGASLRDRGAELLALPLGLARYARGRGTLGIPLLHPWANRLAGDAYRAAGVDVRLDRDARGVVRDEHDLPIHGLLAGSRDWFVRAAGDHALVGELDFGAHPELLRAFPFPHRIELAVMLHDRTLTVRTTMTAGPGGPVPVSFGFHPYLALPGVARADWHVELPAMRRLSLDARGIPDGRSEPAAATSGPLGDRTYDDGFAGVAPEAAFVLAGGDRRVTVRFDAGFPFAQVFAPPELDVVCFEPMTAPANALVSGDGLRILAPGERCTAAFSITVEPR